MSDASTDDPESAVYAEFAVYADAQARRRIVTALVALRHQQHLTQTDVARRIGIDSSNVSRFEAAADNPLLATLQRYARAVGAQLVIHLDVTPEGP